MIGICHKMWPNYQPQKITPKNNTNTAHKYNMTAPRIQQHIKPSLYQKTLRFIESITKQNRNILIPAKPN